ncbi:hypothetical protein [Streptomyces phaeoluteigriseus]
MLDVTQLGTRSGTVCQARPGEKVILCRASAPGRVARLGTGGSTSLPRK